MQAAGGAAAVARRAPVGLFAVAAAVLVADQATKAVVVARLVEGESVRALDGVLRWTLQRNPGAAFGLFARLPVLFTVLAIVISAAIIRSAPRVHDRATSLALGLVLGGALGNLVDRIARPPGPFRGHVIDFIDVRVWPTFNVADAGIVVGAIVLGVAAFRSGPGRSS